MLNAVLKCSSEKGLVDPKNHKDFSELSNFVNKKINESLEVEVKRTVNILQKKFHSDQKNIEKPHFSKELLELSLNKLDKEGIINLNSKHDIELVKAC